MICDPTLDKTFLKSNFYATLPSSIFHLPSNIVSMVDRIGSESAAEINLICRRISRTVKKNSSVVPVHQSIIPNFQKSRILPHERLLFFSTICQQTRSAAAFCCNLCKSTTNFIKKTHQININCREK